MNETYPIFLYQSGTTLPIILTFGAVTTTLSLPATYSSVDVGPSIDLRSKMSKNMHPPPLHNEALLKSSSGRQRRAAGSSAICDKMVNFERLRGALHMARLDCNTCKDSKGNLLKCQPKHLETRIHTFSGKSKGKNVLQYKVQRIPVDCDCS